MYRKDHSVLFTTRHGNLYHVIALGDDPALVLSLGKIHSEKRFKITNLVSVDGKSMIGAVVKYKAEEQKRKLTWLTHDISSKSTQFTPIELPSSVSDHRTLLLYGSGVADTDGKTYVAGRIKRSSGKISPLVLQLSFRQENGGAIQSQSTNVN